MTVKRKIILLTLFLLNTVILVTAIKKQEFNSLGGNINKSETNNNWVAGKLFPIFSIFYIILKMNCCKS